MNDVAHFALKPDPEPCVCGCGVVGPLKRNGHVKGCSVSKCPKCRGVNNKRKGARKQAKAVTALGIPRTSIHPGHEEFMGGLVRVEVKAGAQIKPCVTAYLRMEAQSEAARPIGDNRPFVGVAMPDGASYGVVMFRTDRIGETVAALAEQLELIA